MSWRSAAAADDSAIVEMGLELFREDPGPKPVPAEHTLRTLAAFRAEPARGRALVLPEGRGYCLLSFVWSNELGGEICLVDELFVRRAFRGQGYGRALLQGLLAGSFGTFVAVDLEVTPENHRARGFYLGLGFKPAKNTHMRFRF